MRCETALNQLNARTDGELPAGDAAALDAHLAECAECRAEAEGLSAIDGDLRRAFVPRRQAAGRLADDTIAQMSAWHGALAPDAPAQAVRFRFAWGQALVGLAAGFLLAVAVFQPWHNGPGPRRRPVAARREPSTTTAAPAAFAAVARQPIARLSVASGPVEMCDPSQAQFLACPVEAAIGHDAVVRTGPNTRCEISLEEGGALRLDCNTEVRLREPDVVEVSHGRLWGCSPPGQKGLRIESGGGTILASAATQMAVDCQPQATRLVVVDGAASVQAGPEKFAIARGQQARIVAGIVEQPPESCDPWLETAWVNSVLALRGAEHPELIERVNRLLANVGAAKLSLLYEDELRRLGDGGVPPLVAYLTATRETPLVAQRVTAARIVADVAESRWIADLIALLNDANAEVRFHAARGLERLTGRNQGFETQAWQTASAPSCETTFQKWVSWWSTNRDRYPAARRDVPTWSAPDKRGPGERENRSKAARANAAGATTA